MKPSQLQLANETLKEFYGLSVPTGVLRKIAEDIPQLQEEIEMESTHDEFAREFLLEHVLAFHNIPKTEGPEAFATAMSEAVQQGKLELLDHSKMLDLFWDTDIEV